MSMVAMDTDYLGIVVLTLANKTDKTDVHTPLE